MEGKAEKRVRHLETDLSRLKEKVNALKKEGKMLRSLIKYSSLGIVTVDKKLRVISCNPIFEKLFQYKEREIIGRNLDEVISEKSSFQEAQGYSEKTLLGESVKGTGRRIRKDGTYVMVEFFAVPAIVDGEVVGAYGLYQDISERIETREKLEESEELLKNVFQASPLGIGLVRNRIMQWHNQAMSRMLGYRPEEIIGKDARMLYPNDLEYQRAGECIASLKNGIKTAEVVTRWVRKSGEAFDCHIWYSVLELGHGDRSVLAIAENVTEKRKMEELLQESEARYRQLVEVSPLPICVYDEKNLYFANVAAFRMFKAKSPEDFSGKVVTDFIHPSSLPLAKERVKRVLRGESLPVAYEKLFTLKGDVIEAELHSAPVSHQGKPAIMSVFLDVTERRKAEVRLQEEEERYRKLYEDSKRQEELYRSLLSSSADAIVIYNLKGEAEFISPSFTKTFGWTFEEIKGKKIPFVPDSERERSMAVIADLIKNGTQVHGFETRRLTKEGRLLDISISASRYSDHEGKPAGMLVLLRDITERVGAEAAIRESERRFRELYDSVSDLIYTQDLQGRFISANKALYDILGLTSEEFVGRPGSDFMKPEFRGLFEKEYIAEVMEKGYHHGVAAYFTKDGRKIYIEYRSTLVKPEKGEPYISGIARDVTERVIAEKRIKKLQEEMIQAQKMEAIGTLAGGIAHDFNNILMGIQGNISLMKLHTLEGSPDYERLRGMEEYIQSGSELTTQLLAFARGGRYEVRPTDMNALIEKEIRLFGRAKKEVEIHAKFQDDLWSIEADQGQMEQVLLNLFVNAWQAMSGGGHLFLQTENRVLDKETSESLSLSPGRYVSVMVSDTGAGMDKETLKRIFEPFFTTKKEGRGMGLGLASVYGIIKNHGGAIEVESTPNKGSTFTFYLPATDKPVKTSENEISEEFVPGKGHVMLVDDEVKILEVGEQLLGVLGYDVVTFSRGQEAVEAFMREGGNFDLIILDMIMPEMGGQDVFRALRKINPDVKVLLASGYSIDGEASKIMRMGCNGFIQKPFSMEKLSKKIQEILAGS